MKVLIQNTCKNMSYISETTEQARVKVIVKKSLQLISDEDDID